MRHVREASGTAVVGREAELDRVCTFLDAEEPADALVITGGPGIGKTTLWEQGIAQARGRDMHVLSARASSAEARLSFATLIDICDPIDLHSLEGLATPQRLALEVALMRVPPVGEPPSLQAVALGLLNALRARADGRAVVVAIDDVQWVDQPSSDALAFVARRLASEPIWFLLARRSGTSTELERAFARGKTELLDIGPLAHTAIRHLLVQRLDLRLPRALLRTVVESTGGNPLFALEVGRSIVERGLPQIGEDIPVPDAVEDMLGMRVTRLPPPLRRLLLAVAVSAQPRLTELTSIAGPGVVEDAIDAGVVVLDGDRVRAAHPLLAAAATKRSRPRERRRVHRLLAESVSDVEMSIVHRALGAEGVEEGLAATAAGAAAAAYARGARQQAVLLAEHAVRLTPQESGEREVRMLVLAGYLRTAGDIRRMTDLLSTEVSSLAPGPARGRAWFYLSDGADIATLDESDRLLDRALSECHDDQRLRAEVLAKKSVHAAGIAVTQIRQSEMWAREALECRDGSPDLEALALHALAIAVALSGQPIDALCTDLQRTPDSTFRLDDSPERVVCERLVWRGELPRARELLERMMELADRQGEQLSLALLRLHLGELNLRAGDWESADHLLDLWSESTDWDPIVNPIYERCRALLAAGRGLISDADMWADKAIPRAEAFGVRWDLFEARRARGMAALLDNDPARAVDALRPVWEHLVREGVDEPGAFPVAPDLVEALSELGELAEAAAVTDRLGQLAQRQRHPWGLATAERCAGLIGLASDVYDETAAAALARAAADYERLGLRFDHARSLLSLGRAQRRWKKWGAARDSLEAAIAAFGQLDSPGWAAAARSELSRVGARRPSPPGELTSAQRRTADLAAAGLTNKEIASALHVAVHTVEAHLSRAYATLGVRSRRQLSDRLQGGDTPLKE